MKTRRTRIIIIISAVLAVCVLAAVVLYDALKPETERETASFTAMGSPFLVTAYEGGVDFEKIQAAVTALDGELSRNIADSGISRLNRDKTLAGAPDDLIYCLDAALEVCRASGGALDVTIGEVSSLWDFDSGSGSVPDPAAVNGAVAGVGWSKVEISGDTVTIGEDQSVDPGAVGKGFACDIIKRELDSEGSGAAVISAGGTIMTYGSNPGGKPWSVGIKTPEEDNLTGEYFAKLAVDGTAFISTSGSYEKYFYSGGKLYCHILDPRTGYPADSGLVSVTVIASGGAAADALSTACFVLGYEKSVPLLERFGAEGVFVTAENKVLATKGAEPVLEITDENYR